jgi:branched-chain amino acid aminotransferase
VVSVFDSGFVLGDGVWEGLRVSGGHPAFLDRHLDRLEEGARAILLDLGMTRGEITDAIYATLRANDMTDGVHVRLMVTRGVKSTPYQDPRVTIGPATVVIVAEHKEPMPATVAEGITLFTTHVRRATPDTLDPKAQRAQQAQRHHRVHPGLHGRGRRGADARPARLRGHLQQHALLHRHERGEVWTSDGRFCLGGHHRGNVLEVCRANGLVARETTFSLTDVYNAAEAFVTGTFAGVVPVRTVDGRTIGTGARGPVVERLQGLYQDHVAADVAARSR